MPNYQACWSLRQYMTAARSYDDPTPPTLVFLGFWKGFYDADDSSLRCFLRTLFYGIGLSGRTIHIVSVFGTPEFYARDLPALRRQAPPDSLWVCFSGEQRALPPDGFHVNLIMEPTDLTRRIVSLPNFVSNAHELGLWPQLSATRPQFSPAKKHFCAFVVRNGNNPIRNQFVRRLSQAHKRVDCLGSFMNNMPGGETVPEDAVVYGDRYLEVLQRYKFVICFENCSQPANLTEKLLNAWLAGTVPIYWGCPGVLEWLNPRAFLYLPDGSAAAMDALIAKIKELDESPTAYYEVFRQPLIDPTQGIPYTWGLEHLREKIETLSRRPLPDLGK